MGTIELRYSVLVSAASADEAGGLMFHEWMPVDAETWEKLEILRARHFRAFVEYTAIGNCRSGDHQ
jgi:hypothetical protein